VTLTNTRSGASQLTTIFDNPDAARGVGQLRVRRELMRHADIRTAMNDYGKAMDESKREAHWKVVCLVLPSEVAWWPLAHLENVAIGLKRRK
jgi:hypothetical protein